MKRLLFTISACFSTLLALSQLFPRADYPENYFRDPLAIPMSLAANFGELRPNHYHMGLDIRTQHRENLPVFAAADGYVTRVQIEPAGFGQAIYIRHPNGYTTVYGHLNQFFPALAAYVKEQQYRQQSWQVDLSIPPALFPLKKGDFIAYSGNTGGSQGPHLHFEIRRTAGDINLNPLLFGLPVPDNTPPTLVRLAWYDRNQGIYEQSPQFVPLTTSLLTVPTTRVSFAISAFDTQSGSANPNGVFQAYLYEDDHPLVGFRMDNISYNDTRNINAHIDYMTKAKGGPFLQHLSFFTGYPIPSIYRSFDPDSSAGGVVDLRDGRLHIIRIEVLDTRQNKRTLTFKVQYQGSPASPTLSGTAATRLAAAASGAAATSAVPGATGAAAKKFYPGMLDGIETDEYAFYLSERSLYDSALIGSGTAGYPGSGLSLPGAVSAAYKIGDPGIPLLEPVLVRLKPTPPVKMAAGGKNWLPGDTDRIVMVDFRGTEKEVVRPQWQGGWAAARFREFGNFQLVRDTVPPLILPIGPLEGADLSRAARIAFSIKDNLGAIRHFRAELDGSWLCFTNDKGLAFIYKFDEHCPPGGHELKITVEDVAGNSSTTVFHFTR